MIVRAVQGQPGRVRAPHAGSPCSLEKQTHQEPMLNRHSTFHFFLGWLVLAAAGMAPAAHAALGGDVETVAQDRARIKATALRTTVRTVPAGTASGGTAGAAPAAAIATATATATAYTVHEMMTPAGTVVREFSGPNGKVFAVTWSGPAVPDLRQLLGAHFDTYATPSATGPRPRARAHRTVARGDLVVQSMGRMRAFSGKAYLASLVPSGVAIDALQ
jgi:hypothetical protein